MQRATLSRYALVPLVLVVLAAAIFDLLDLTRALPTGSAPGEGPHGEFLVPVAALALLAFGFACFYLARSARPVAFAWLAAPLAGLFTLAHYYSYDDYCGGYACRVSSEAPTAWKGPVVLAGAGLVAGAIAYRRPRLGLRATALVAIFSALVVIFVPFGH